MTRTDALLRLQTHITQSLQQNGYHDWKHIHQLVAVENVFQCRCGASLEGLALFGVSDPDTPRRKIKSRT